MHHHEVMRKEWLPVAFSHELADSPVGTIALGERIVLFRTSGGIHAMKDLCIHRGAPLSQGKVVEDAIVCPYHGWRYDATGKCILIPQQRIGQTIPPKACATPYRCREADGFIWIQMDENPETPFPDYEEFAADSGFRNVLCGPYDVNASAPRLIENFLDVGHLAFLHEGILGDPAYPEISDYNVHRLENTLRSDEIDVYQPDPDGRGKPVVSRYVYEVLRPTVARLKKWDPETGHTLSMLFAVLPQGETASRVYAVISLNYDFDLPDKHYQDFEALILSQDVAILENQRPELLPLDLQAELHLKADRMSIAYRRWLSELQVGWGTV